MKKISAIAAPDRTIMDAAHGPNWRATSQTGDCEAVAQNNQRRDKAEQAIMCRWARDRAFAAECAAMTDHEWDEYLTSQCGPRPGATPEDTATRAARRERHKGRALRPYEVKTLEMRAAGYETVVDLCERVNVPEVRVRQWIYRGYHTATGENVRLRVERVGGRMLFTRPEWFEEFLAGAPPVLRLASETRARNTKRVDT